jgi:hypothetical protein
MQPGYPGPGQDPYGPQPPHTDPYAQPQYPPPPQPPTDPYAPPPPQDPYATPAYQQPTQHLPPVGYGPPQPAPAGNNVFAILSLIFGIAGIPLGCCSHGILGIVLGGTGAALGLLGMQKAPAAPDRPGLGGRNLALAGAVCGGVAAVLGLATLLLYLVTR